MLLLLAGLFCWRCGACTPGPSGEGFAGAFEVLLNAIVISSALNDEECEQAYCSQLHFLAVKGAVLFAAGACSWISSVPSRSSRA